MRARCQAGSLVFGDHLTRRVYRDFHFTSEVGRDVSVRHSLDLLSALRPGQDQFAFALDPEALFASFSSGYVSKLHGKRPNADSNIS